MNGDQPESLDHHHKDNDNASIQTAEQGEQVSELRVREAHFQHHSEHTAQQERNQPQHQLMQKKCQGN